MRAPYLLSFLCLAACAGQQPATQQTTLAEANLLASGDWIELDLTSGAVNPVSGTPDPRDARWHDAAILFRHVPAGTALIGRPAADTLVESDEQPRRQITLGHYWIAACELTQAQWVRMAGTHPWFPALPPIGDLAAWSKPRQPAFGMSPAMIEPVLARWSRNSWTLDLPDGQEWEHACLAGSDQKFHWGKDLSHDTWKNAAICNATILAPVASVTPNAWGLHDMHGNVWEMTRNDYNEIEVRGGAWDQDVVAARASNRCRFNAAKATVMTMHMKHWTIGCRLVLRR